MTPDDFWPIEPKYQESYDEKVAMGVEAAARSKAAIVAIARNAMPFLENTLMLVDELAEKFRSTAMYVFENDSDDGTITVLDAYAATRPWVTVEHDTLQRPDFRGFEPERTVALAEYRNRCRLWVEHHASDVDYVVVLDMDPHGGFSVGGVMNSIGWLREMQSRTARDCGVGGMASYSLFARTEEGGKIGASHYDAYAARLSWWEDRRHIITNMWFHMLLPPVGGVPIRMNSAFGGLAVYRAEAFLAPGVHYAGGDCEHVNLHKSMAQAGYGMWLNPGCRYAAILPETQ